MRPIKDIPYLDNARNAEHWYLVMQLLEILTAEFAAKYGLTSRLAKAKAVFERENAAFKTEVGYEDTTSVNEADLARDKVYRRIKATAHMAELSDDAEVAAAAVRLLKRILEASGDVTRAPQGEATAIYADIVEKLQSDIYAADVTAIGATADVAQLKEANDELGKVLIKSFIFAVTQLEQLPKTMLFYNGGATLTTEGSDSLEDLKSLEAQGVEILTCGTCLDYYGLKDKLAVGGVTNMYSIVEAMAGAGRIIRP